jgi:hypothetical protein
MTVCTPLVVSFVRVFLPHMHRLSYLILLSIFADLYHIDTPTLTVNIVGTGSGTTTVSVNGATAEACNTGCTINMPTTTSVVNIATAEATGSFAAVFTGACTDVAGCGSLSMDDNKIVTVTYEGVYLSCCFSSHI